MKQKIILAYPLTCSAPVHPEVVEDYDTKIALLRTGVPVSFPKPEGQKHWFDGTGKGLPDHLVLQVEIDIDDPDRFFFHIRTYAEQHDALSGICVVNRGHQGGRPQDHNWVSLGGRIPFAEKDTYAAIYHALQDAVYCLLFTAPATDAFRKTLADPALFRRFSLKMCTDLKYNLLGLWEARGVSHHDLLLAHPWRDALISKLYSRMEKRLATLGASCLD